MLTLLLHISGSVALNALNQVIFLKGQYWMGLVGLSVICCFFAVLIGSQLPVNLICTLQIMWSLNCAFIIIQGVTPTKHLHSFCTFCTYCIAKDGFGPSVSGGQKLWRWQWNNFAGHLTREQHQMCCVCVPLWHQSWTRVLLLVAICDSISISCPSLQSTANGKASIFALAGATLQTSIEENTQERTAGTGTK